MPQDVFFRAVRGRVVDLLVIVDQAVDRGELTCEEASRIRAAVDEKGATGLSVELDVLAVVASGAFFDYVEIPPYLEEPARRLVEKGVFCIFGVTEEGSALVQDLTPLN